MSTTEDYLDQLLRNVSGENKIDIGESKDEQQNEESAFLTSGGIEENPVADGLSLEQALEMSVADVLDEMDSVKSEGKPEADSEPEIVPESEAENGMLSEEAIAAMFAANEIAGPESEKTEEAAKPEADSEPEVVPEPEAENGILSEEAIAAMFAANEIAGPESEKTGEAAKPEADSEPEVVPEPETENGMLSEEAIAAMFAANESEKGEKNEEPQVQEEQQMDTFESLLEEEIIPLEDEAETVEVQEEISLDDMLAGMREKQLDVPQEENTVFQQETMMESEEESGGEGDDNILDLLSLMSEDEDLKDIGDLLKSDENLDIDISDEELFAEPPLESEEAMHDSEGKDKKQGFFEKLFGKKRKESKAEKNAANENEQIIKEVEDEIKEEEKEEKVKKKKGKKDKKKGKDGEEGKKNEEGAEKIEKKGKNKKKEKEKKERPPKVKEITPKEPPLPKKPVILIMLMAASILALVLLSHNVVDYQFSISRADSSFINRNYEEAYENILGVDVKEDDKQLYHRIRIMMKLEAKYKMYLSHIEQEKYDEALNDLIMGIIKYDQYVKEAQELGIQQAFDDELALIEEQLNVVYGVDAEQARNWYNTLSALDYTHTIRGVVKAAGYSIEEAEAEQTTSDLSQFGIEEVE